MGPRDLTRQVRQQPRRFYDGGVLPGEDRPPEPPDPGADPRIVLERHTQDLPTRPGERLEEVFSLERRLAYLDRHVGEILVPASLGFRTDLTSVPAVFRWLVPKTGAHLPAAILHDALVTGDDPASYVVEGGRRVDRVEADRIFRDAMADTGTGVVRRWIVWSAVTVATVLVGRPVPWPAWRTWTYRLAAAVTILSILWLGWSATADLVDQDWWLAVELPWMGERGWWTEVAGGLSAAIVVPLALSLLWGRLRVAGAIAGVMLGVLLHVTVAIALIGATYLAVEWVARRSALAGWTLAAVVVLAALVTFGAVSLG